MTFCRQRGSTKGFQCFQCFLTHPSWLYWLPSQELQSSVWGCWGSSSGQSASDTDSFLKQLLSFEFFVAAVICRHVLAYTRSLIVALQANDCDLHKAHRMAQRLVTALSSERAADKFHDLWQRITTLSADIGIEPAKKRSVRVQRNHVNPPVEDIESHYRVASYYAFLDHTISHLKTRFPPELEGALLATYLLPSCLPTLPSFQKRFNFCQNKSRVRCLSPSPFQLWKWNHYMETSHGRAAHCYQDGSAVCVQLCPREQVILPKHSCSPSSSFVSSHWILLLWAVLQWSPTSQDMVA